MRSVLRDELHQLVTIAPSDRPWQMPFAAARASGLPLVVGAVFGRLDYGLVSSLAGLTFVYLPRTPLHHRMSWVMGCGFGMIACFTFGVLSHFVAALVPVMLTLITLLVSIACRFYRVGPPGILFFLMAAAIGAYAPVEIAEVPTRVGLFAMGSLLAVVIGFFYSAMILYLRIRTPLPIAPLARFDFDFIITDSVVIAVFAGLSLGVAAVLQLQRPYWVAVSCLAVIQGLSLRAVWNKQLHRILGTALGMVLSWVLLSLPLETWSICLMIAALTFVIETAVVRHYGFAVVFITPLTLFMAEAGHLGHGVPTGLIAARFIDTVVGCAVGLGCGFCLHHPDWRTALGRQLRRLAPKASADGAAAASGGEALGAGALGAEARD